MTSPFLVPFKDLPNPKRVWVGKPGSAEEGIGKVSILTPEVVNSAAKSEIQTGRRVTLNWELTKLENAQFGRFQCRHRIVTLPGDEAFDDIYEMNPQQSSQWDGMRHHSQPESDDDPVKGPKVWYGGTTAEEIMDRNNTRIGIQHWARAGLAGRGVLLDYASWAERQGITYTTFSNHQVKLSDLKAIATESNVTFQPGDLLFVRIGVTKEWDEKMTVVQKEAYQQQSMPQHAGVEATIEVAEWLWNNHFSAVAGDAISWEVFPKQKPPFGLHEYLLAGWGVPIGELFDLESLAATCKELQRWTFFVTAAPLNMPGGVSSPPNAMAIF